MKRIFYIRDCFTQIFYAFSYLKPRYCSLLAAVTTMCLYAHAQSPEGFGAAASGGLPNTTTPLQIGDTIPEYLWHLRLQVVNHPEGKETITLDEYRGKLIILDFWATWCGSCIRAFPKLDSLQSQFKEDIAGLKVTTQPGEKVNLPVTSIVADTILSTCFQHRVLPHYVWISPVGRVVAFTSEAQLSKANVRDALLDKALNTPIKRDLDIGKPPFLMPDFQPEELAYNATLIHGWYYGLSSRSQYRYAKDSLLVGLTMANVDLLSMFQQIARHLFTALGDSYSPNKLVLAVDDTTAIKTDYLLPLPQLNVYTYDVNMGPTPKDEFIQLVWQDLNRLTPYQATVEPKAVECYVLSANKANLPVSAEDTTPEITIKKNQPGYIRKIPIARLVEFINYLNLLPLPLIDKTGLVGNYDLDLPPIGNIVLLKEQLAQHGLHLIKTRKEINTLTIKDKL